jgi:hypothetical protein
MIDERKPDRVPIRVYAIASVSSSILPFVNCSDSNCRCNIKMTPFSKVETALCSLSGLQEEVPNDGGVNDRQEVSAA